jgi:hypothetical protein
MFPRTCVSCNRLRPWLGFPQDIKDHLKKVCFLCWNNSFVGPLDHGRAVVRITDKLEGSGLKCVSHDHHLSHKEVHVLLSQVNWVRYDQILWETYGYFEGPQRGTAKVMLGLVAIAADEPAAVDHPAGRRDSLSPIFRSNHRVGLDYHHKPVEQDCVFRLPNLFGDDQDKFDHTHTVPATFTWAPTPNTLRIKYQEDFGDDIAQW